MEKLKALLPKILYILGGLTILLAPVRFFSILSIGARGYSLTGSDWLNYGIAAISTCGTGLLYMAAARVIELLEKPAGENHEETF